MRYITDSIGSEYEKWTEESSVFLSSPTGSGKTTFILKTFLPYWASKGKKVLYLVNRTILKKQIEEEVNQLTRECRMAIKVELYQTIEQKILNNALCEYGYQVDFQIIKNRYFMFDCVVCDEAHYFLMDSNYNINTILAYCFVRDLFSCRLRIYMSATIKQIEKYVKDDNKKQRFCGTDWFGYCLGSITRYGLFKKEWPTYKAERDYGHIDLTVIRGRDEAVNAIVDEGGKWLVFVDSKEFGKKLKNEILALSSKGDTPLGKDDVVFVTSDYNEEFESTQEVKGIVETQKQSAPILIATSVLDNGINIKDIELRNIFIIADTETEFIQMLGRKRRDGKRVKLYIYKQTKEHFRKRKRLYEKRQKIADEYYKAFRNLMDKSSTSGDIDNLKLLEKRFIVSQHRILLHKLMNNKISFEDVKSMFLAIEGVLHLNPLSMQNIENLNAFYGKILSEFEAYGDNAFLRQQLRWLNKTDEEIERIISEADLSLFERSQDNVIKKLREICGKAIEEKEFVKLKEDMRNDLRVLVEHVDESNKRRKTYLDLVRKNERPISGPFLEFLRENCAIPFAVEKNGSAYMVSAVEN